MSGGSLEQRQVEKDEHAQSESQERHVLGNFGINLTTTDSLCFHGRLDRMWFQIPHPHHVTPFLAATRLSLKILFTELHTVINSQ